MSSSLYHLISTALLLTTLNADGMFDNIVNSFFGGEQQQHGGQQVRRRGHGNRPRTQDARMDIQIPLKELYLGSQRQISYQRNVVCTHCQGTGAEGGETTRCRKCKGQGHIIENVQVMPGFRMQQQKTCPVCGGKGVQYKHKCKHCHGNGVHRETTKIDIDIEKGMHDGQEIVFHEKSEERPGHLTGDLIAVIKQEEHQYFQREGNDLHTAVDLNMKQALLGFDLNIEHLDKELVNLRHTTEVTQHLQVRRYSNKGMPVYRRPRKFGDMHIEYRVELPKEVNAKQRKSLIELFPDMSLIG
eukprot:88977_1